ncbi:hydrogenase 4 subunit B [Cupriavidus necator]|uniref:Formate hydrogenlyase subunit 3 n=1 Tax=Cupriavidus necator (strain ATCC 17699 / DSM 428 / KCTC 22496 / NCIMB 10442 / H16 / Stanier 337) TaxID=381666 RepID=Q0K9M8_CUPNH|nr:MULTISPECIES: hydrogenase 4 subunit B [Cupriavidus]EON20207.1 hydrogenase 4 subunit B [Cupriavidus sp. GA3-3]QCC01103.1 hydrogenase 4 subunit B [Cupriavidus necator H16]QQB76073.1 hydrogenase 4 subunit B [Cupriavidus necator]WKA39480.1 hydrogenase 4 subunit B [Cupriavidus necator]CAJ93293.1 formate hydrogenlyase subunit 3 [Cupriavidus necator H16]
MSTVPPLTQWLHLDWMLVVVGAWLLIGVAGVLALHRFALVSHVLFPIGGLLGLALFSLALHAVSGTPEAAVLPIGLPSLPFHVRLDSLSAYFLMVMGGAAAGISTFAAGYFRTGEGTPPGLLCLEYHLFLASMAGVILADDAYSFMVMWETMALASFFLVTANHRIAEVRAAGYLYITMARIGAIAILLCFGVLQANTGDYTFANMRAQALTPFWASAGFLLALFGFGAKAGILPLHIWLPEAHPAAPSPVSAMMSGVMLNTAIYGLLRVSFDLLPMRLWWWGGLLLAIGLATALFGVVFAAVQTDMKRLLAYSSIENMGLLFVAMGLTLLFSAYGMKPMAALALTAALYHVASHAFFKSLLFLGTGSVLHATTERSLGKLGGLIRYMPWVGWLTLLGVLASAGLPPLGGFVSEWLLLQSFLFTPGLPEPILTMLIPVVAALIALVAALAGYTMVKFFGVIFLGQPREPRLVNAHDAGRWERAGMLWLALGCIALGLLPTQFVQLIDPVTQQLVASGLGARTAASSWLLAPNGLAQASYGPVIFLSGILASVALAYLLVRRLYHGRLRRSPPWACGFPWGTARMQDTAEGFGQPIRQIFEPFFLMRRDLPTPFDEQPHYRVTVADHFWRWMYVPVIDLASYLARLIGLMQQGRISVYLLYSFLTLAATLLAVM